MRLEGTCRFPDKTRITNWIRQHGPRLKGSSEFLVPRNLSRLSFPRFPYEPLQAKKGTLFFNSKVTLKFRALGKKVFGGSRLESYRGPPNT